MATKNKKIKKILPKNISKSENKLPKKVVISNNKIKTLPKIPINQIISSKSFKDRLDSIVNEIEVDISDIPEELLDDYYDMEDEIKPKLIKKNWLLWSSIFIPFVLPSYIKGMSGTVELPPDAKQSVLVPAPAPKQVTDYAKQYFTNHGLELVKTLTQTDCERLKIQMLNNWGMGEDKFASSFKEDYANSKSRLETIYRTEKVKAENEGIMARAKNANHTKVIWNCALDERSCEICSSLQGQVTNIGEVFEGTNVTSPPIHPSCRCVLTSLTEEDYDELPDEYIRQDASYLNDVASFIKQNRKCKVGTYDDSNACSQKLNSLLNDVASFMKLNYKCRKEDSPDGSNKCKLPDESDNTEQKLFDNIKPDKYGSISGSVSKIKEYYINKSLSWKPSNNYMDNLKNSDKAIVSNPENSEILSKYIHSSKFINESLRDKKSTENLEYKNKLNKLIDQSPLQQDVILYRGISPEALDKYFPKDKNTIYAETGGFASFSGSEEIAKAYSTALSRDMLNGKELFPGKNPVIIELHAKQGTPGLFVENYEKKQKFDDNIPPLHEVILKTDQKYKLLDVKKEKYYTRYVVESITSMRRNERYLEEVTEFLKLNKKCKAGTYDDSNKCGPEKESTSTGSTFQEVSSTFNPELGGFHTTDYKTTNSKPLRVISQDKTDNPKVLEAIKDIEPTQLPSQFLVMKMKAGTLAKYYTKTDSIGVDKSLSSSEMTAEIKKVLDSMKTNSAYLQEAAAYLILQDAAVKLNANCKDEEKNGTGPGSCGGGNTTINTSSSKVLSGIIHDK